MTDNVTSTHVTGGNPEVMSFNRNSPGSSGNRRKTGVVGAFELLQGCNS